MQSGDFLRCYDGRNIFAFTCSCGASGEIGVLEASNRVIKHECGKLWMQQPRHGLFDTPKLIEVNT